MRRKSLAQQHVDDYPLIDYPSVESQQQAEQDPTVRVVTVKTLLQGIVHTHLNHTPRLPRIRHACRALVACRPLFFLPAGGSAFTQEFEPTLSLCLVSASRLSNIP